MQRAKRILATCILILCLNRAATISAQETARQSKSEVAARKAAAAKAVDKARATAKLVQKAQQHSVASRTKADKLIEVAAADKAKLAAALGRNASPKETEHLTQIAQKSADAARLA